MSRHCKARLSSGGKTMKKSNPRSHLFFTQILNMSSPPKILLTRWLTYTSRTYIHGLGSPNPSCETILRTNGCPFPTAETHDDFPRHCIALCPILSRLQAWYPDIRNSYMKLSRQTVILQSMESFSVENLQALVIRAFDTVSAAQLTTTRLTGL
jgi:hypothetical protein